MPERFRHVPGRLASMELRGLMLFPLLLPLLPAIAFSLLRGRADHLMAEVIAIGAIGGGALLVRRGLRKERRGERAAAARSRWSGIGALALGSVACNAVLAGHPAEFTALAAGLVIAGGWLSYGADAPRPAAVGLEPTARRQLEQARAQIAALQETATRLHQPALRDRLRRIAGRADTIVDLLAKDPRDIATARRFLAVYLDGALRVSRQYERTALEHGVTVLETRFIDMLDTIERVFEQQYQRLLADDLLDLDVQIEVLKSRLDHEGIA